MLTFYLSKILTSQLNWKLIEKKRPRRRKPRLHKNRNSNHIRSFDNRGMNTPRTRGALSKVLEKYTTLAQDAFSNGDRIVAENYYQYAEHYQRVLNETKEDDKPDSTVNISHINSNTNNIRPSRTERALSAKNQREDNFPTNDKQSSTNSTEIDKNEPRSKNKDESFTSDGIEALKPFEV